ncbi:MAG: carbohydrate ABC transporter permease [Firmicutes bacterium]|nr:carbohydrate ABC transporter permease [Bacillota bacterium]
MKSFSEKKPGLLMPNDLKSIKGKTIYWILFSILIILCITTFFPAIWMVLTAFKSTQEIYSSTAFFPKEFSFVIAIKRITTAWKSLELGRSMVNTIIVSIGNVIAQIFICGLAGYVLSKLRVKGTKLVFVLVVWTMMMPGAIRTVPTYMSYISFPFVIDDKFNSFTNINILDTYVPLWLGAAANSFNIILFKNNFDSIPTALVEAARIDGCSDFKTFYKIMIPIALPVVIFVCIGALSGTWANYFSPYLVLKDTAKMTTPARIFILKSDASITANIYMMGLIFASIPSLIIFIVFQKYIVGGVTLGAVKG